MIIRNITDLATYYETTADNLSADIHGHTDYNTVLLSFPDAVRLVTVVDDYGISNARTLPFPFSSDDFDDAVSSLQCWADYVWCENYRKEC